MGMFNVFTKNYDASGTEIADVICGMALLCKGGIAEKLNAVMLAFGSSADDNFISRGDMLKFLTIVFHILLSPRMQGVIASIGISASTPESLALATVAECFKQTAGCHDPSGRIPICVLEEWLGAPRQDPSEILQLST